MMTSAVRARPILFSAPMIRAILDGAKTQTRRVVRLRDRSGTYSAHDDDGWPMSDHDETGGAYRRDACPFGSPGDRLWARETWQHADWTEDGEPFVRYAADGSVRFCADTPEDDTLEQRWADLSADDNYAIDGKAADRRWRPSIFMPRWASRITLEITDVRVERLQEISRADALAEGVGTWRDGMTEKEHAWLYLNAVRARAQCGDDSSTGKRLYSLLWDTLNAKRAPWSSNPFVWCITFRRAP